MQCTARSPYISIFYLIIFVVSCMAGRLGPGVCLRLWAEKAVLADAPQPEILDADLASLALALALRADGSAAEPAGCGDQGPEDPGVGAGLRWLDAPPTEALAATQALLRLLGAVDAGGMATAAGAPRSPDLPVLPCGACICVCYARLSRAVASADQPFISHTARINPAFCIAGRRMADLGEHPRLARLAVAAADAGVAEAGCLVAAALGERDVFRGAPRGADLALRLRAIAAACADLPGRDADAGLPAGDCPSCDVALVASVALLHGALHSLWHQCKQRWIAAQL